MPGVVGDEKWRKHAVASQVYYKDDGRGARSCRTRPSGSFFWSDCADDELVLQPPPTGLLMKVMLWFPYPIIDDIDLQDELPCMD